MESQSTDRCRLCKPTSLQIWEVYWEIPEVRQGSASSAVPQVWFLLMVNFGRCHWIQIICFAISILTSSHAPLALITSCTVSDVASVGRQGPSRGCCPLYYRKLTRNIFAFAGHTEGKWVWNILWMDKQNRSVRGGIIFFWLSYHGNQSSMSQQGTLSRMQWAL